MFLGYDANKGGDDDPVKSTGTGSVVVCPLFNGGVFIYVIMDIFLLYRYRIGLTLRAQRSN